MAKVKISLADYSNNISASYKFAIVIPQRRISLDPRLMMCAKELSVRFEWWDVWVYLHNKHNMTGEDIVNFLKANVNLEMIAKIACDIIETQKKFK